MRRAEVEAAEEAAASATGYDALVKRAVAASAVAEASASWRVLPNAEASIHRRIARLD